MKNYFRSLLLALTATSAVATDGIMIPDGSAWARATPPGTTTTAIYLTLMNHGDKDISLVSAASDISDRIELHTHRHKDGLMQMLQVDSIKVEAGDQTELKSHADHIMVFNLDKALTAGNSVTVELMFDNGVTQTVEVPVLKEAPQSDSPKSEDMKASHDNHGKHKKKHDDHN